MWRISIPSQALTEFVETSATYCFSRHMHGPLQEITAFRISASTFDDIWDAENPNYSICIDHATCFFLHRPPFDHRHQLPETQDGNSRHKHPPRVLWDSVCAGQGVHGGNNLNTVAAGSGHPQWLFASRAPSSFCAYAP